MGEALPLFSAEFNGSIRVETRPEHLTSDAGVIALREGLERLRMWDWLAEQLHDPRNPAFITYSLGELVKTAVMMLAQGYRDHDDADALRFDAALRLAVSDRKGDSPLRVPKRPEGTRPPSNPAHPEHLASQPTLSRLTAILSTASARQSLREGLVVTAGRRITAQRGRRLRRMTLDIDSLPVEVHGHQPEAAFNGHYHAKVYHPLIATSADTGDLLDLELRRGNAHTADGALPFLERLIDRVQKHVCEEIVVRIDAGFPNDPTLSALEKRGIHYVSRVKNNPVLDRMAKKHLHRPVGRRPKEPRTWLYEMEYRAESWSRARRVVLVVLERQDELFLHHFWLITNWTAEQMSAEALLKMYRERGTAEGHFGELLSVLNPALSSSPRPKQVYAGRAPKKVRNSIDCFAVNEVRLLLNAWAYQAMHVCRTLLAADTGEGWSLQRFRERLLKVAARVLLHGRRVTFVIANSATELWGALWRQLGRLACPPTG